MTAGMATRSMEGSRISLPRAGLGALLVGTLLAGSLLGAAIYAGIVAATGSSDAIAAAVVSTPRESAVVRQARIDAGSGQLAGDVGATQAFPTSRTIPYRGDGFGGDGFNVAQPNIQPPAGSTIHAPGRGPLR